MRKDFADVGFLLKRLEARGLRCSALLQKDPPLERGPAREADDTAGASAPAVVRLSRASRIAGTGMPVVEPRQDYPQAGGTQQRGGARKPEPDVKPDGGKLLNENITSPTVRVVGVKNGACHRASPVHLFSLARSLASTSLNTPSSPLPRASCRR